jgi:hypothetical protein
VPPIPPSSTGGFVTGDPIALGQGTTTTVDPLPVPPSSTGGFVTGDPIALGQAALPVPPIPSDPNSSGDNGSPILPSSIMNVYQNPVTSPVASPPSSALIAPPDLRVRLSALNPDDVYPKSGSILSVLAETGGMLFPYTPQIGFSQQVSYADLQLVHSNTDYPAYTRTPSVTITVTGKFTVQNQREGRYAMAAIHFLRTASKSYFGELDAKKAGLPPPVLVFSGYGPYLFSNVRVILKSHSWAFDENMDTVSVAILGKTVRLPAMFSLQVELQVVQTPNRMLTKFSFDAFARGDLLSDGFL